MDDTRNNSPNTFSAFGASPAGQTKTRVKTPLSRRLFLGGSRKHQSLFFPHGIENHPPARIHQLLLGGWATATYDCYDHRLPHEEEDGQAVLWLHAATPRDRFVFLVMPVAGVTKPSSISERIWQRLFGGKAPIFVRGWPAAAAQRRRRRREEQRARRRSETFRSTWNPKSSGHSTAHFCTLLKWGERLWDEFALRSDVAESRTASSLSFEKAGNVGNAAHFCRSPTHEPFARAPMSTEMPSPAPILNISPFRCSGSRVALTSKTEIDFPEADATTPQVHCAESTDRVLKGQSTEQTPNNEPPIGVAVVEVQHDAITAMDLTAGLTESRWVIAAAAVRTAWFSSVRSVEERYGVSVGEFSMMMSTEERAISFALSKKGGSAETPPRSEVIPQSVSVVHSNSDSPERFYPKSPDVVGKAPQRWTTVPSAKEDCPFTVKRTLDEELSGALETSYSDTMVVLRSQDPMFLGYMREVFLPPHSSAPFATDQNSQQRLLRRLEGGIVPWAILLARWGLHYRHMVRLVAVFLTHVWPLIALSVALYDLYRHVPFLRVLLLHPLVPMLSWVEAHVDLRVPLLGTYFFTVLWHLFASLHAYAVPLGPPIRALRNTLRYVAAGEGGGTGGRLSTLLGGLWTLVEYLIQGGWGALRLIVVLSLDVGSTFLSPLVAVVEYGFQEMVGAVAVLFTGLLWGFFTPLWVVWKFVYSSFLGGSWKAWETVVCPACRGVQALFYGARHVVTEGRRHERSRQRQWAQLMDGATSMLRTMIARPVMASCWIGVATIRLTIRGVSRLISVLAQVVLLTKPVYYFFASVWNTVFRKRAMAAVVVFAGVYVVIRTHPFEKPQGVIFRWQVAPS